MVAGIASTFLNLTGRSKGVTGVTPYSNPINVTTGGGYEEGGAVPSRALDRAPRGQGFEYNEYSNIGAGYAGKSKWSCYM